jgi:hypothetical protein
MAGDDGGALTKRNIANRRTATAATQAAKGFALTSHGITCG